MLKKYRLSCKEVSHLASDYLDKTSSTSLNWKIHLHLLACSCCRRFIRHLKITRQIAPPLIQQASPEIDADSVLRRIKERQRMGD
ncbi:MAG TPA: hypothetical protein VN030_01080 [Cellvibrio sp.]|nr:hypothetical protein [Cellvibrio sp.]